MFLDLNAARKEQAQREALYYRNNPGTTEKSVRLVWTPFDGEKTNPKDVEPKYRVERPYLPQNRRCKRFAAN